MVAKSSETAADFYRALMHALTRADVPFLVGGAFALGHYTGLSRNTKDLDLFVRWEDCERVREVAGQAGWRTELTFSHWLAKVFENGDFVDVIFSSGNGVAVVDEGWFAHAEVAEVLGVRACLCPIEEMIWSKSFIMERERCDEADVMHLLHARAETLDWARLLRRFGPHWRLLLSQLLLFGFVYPAEHGRVPAWVLDELLSRLRAELLRSIDAPDPPARLCQGTLLSRAQYLVDIERWGYEDARLHLPRPMTPEEIARWTEGIARDGVPG